MKLLKWNWILLSAAASFAVERAPGVQAAEASSPAPGSLTTIDALVAEVLASNPELNFYRAEVALARGERRAATAWANPELSAQAGQKRVRAGRLSDEGTAWAVSVQQTFEWPGRMPLRKAIANHQVQLAELGLAQFTAALSARTRALAYNLLATQEKAAATQEVADRFQELREVLVQRDPAGLTPLLETRIIEATELTLKRRASEAEAATQAATLELHQLRGAAWTNVIRIESARLNFKAPPDNESLFAATRTNNFELQMRQAELEQQGFKVSLARKEGYPALTVGPYFAQERAGEREQQIGIALSLPLPLWNRNRGGVESAEARRQQAETSLLVTQRNIERQVVEKVQAYDTRRREMARWRSDSVEEFRQAAELADRHYRLGAVPIATYVELQKQYLEAVEALLDTKREALEAAQALEQLTGLTLSLVNIAGKETRP